MQSQDLEMLREQVKDEKWQYYTLVGTLRAFFAFCMIVSLMLVFSWKLPSSNFPLWQCAIPLIVYTVTFLLVWFYLDRRYGIWIEPIGKTVYLKKNPRVTFPFPKIKSLFRDS